MIKILAIGNLGKDCIVNNVSGKSVINFSVAHTSKYKDRQGQTVEKTTWLDCSYWSDNTAIAPYLVKGRQVYIEGEPEVRTYTKQDGTAGASQGVRVFTIQLIGGAQNNAGAAENTGSADNTGTNNAAPNTSPAATKGAAKGKPAQQPAAAEVNEELPF